MTVPFRALAGTALAAAALTAATALTGCSAVHTLTAAEKLDRAQAALGDAHAVSLTLSLHATAAQLVALDTTSGDGPSDDKAAAALLRDGTLTLRLSAPGPIKEADMRKEHVAVSFAAAGGQVAELRLAGGHLYAHASLTQTEKVADIVSPGTGAKLDAAITSGWMPSALTQLAAGDWIDVRSTQLTGALDRALRTADAQQKASAGKIASLMSVLRGDLTIRDAGTDNGRDHLIVSAPARKVVQDVLSKLGPLEGLGSFDTAKLADVPDRTVSVDMWLTGGHLAAMQVDLAALTGTTGIGTVPLRVDIDDHAAPVTVPQDAKTFDVDTLLTAFGTSN